jgi:S-(hydroxymethyl)glutathione dehydrogenase/alcohol dehydrogenase
MGATDAIPGGEGALEAIWSLTAGMGADVVLECAGTEETLRMSAEAARPGGEVIWLGKLGLEASVTFRWGSLMGEKRIIRSSYGGAQPRQDFPALARMYLDGGLQLDQLISRRIQLGEINSGLADLRSSENIRTIVTF